MVLFWKLLFLGFVTFSYMVLKTDNWVAAFLKNPKYTAALAIFLCFTTLGISLGVLLTYASNALFAYSLDPIWGAMLGWIFLGDVLPLSTIVALGGALVAMVVMFLPAIQAQDGKTLTSVVGDVLALGAGVAIALYLTILRWMFLNGKIVNAVGASGTGNLAGALVVGIIARIADVPLLDPDVPRLFYVVAFLNGCAVSCVVIAFTIAPKYITGAHIGLVSLIETILGPLWVFAAFGEQPPVFTLIGGAIVLVVIFTHEWIAIRDAGQSHSVAAEAQPGLELGLGGGGIERIPSTEDVGLDFDSADDDEEKA